MVYKYPKPFTVQKITLSPQFGFPQVHFLFPDFIPSPCPSPLPLPSHSSQELGDRKWTPASCHFIRRFPRAHELQPWLWNGSVRLINDWGSATTTSPPDSPKCTQHSWKEAAREGHQSILDNHRDQGQSQMSKGRLPGEPTSTPDRKDSPPLPFREWAGREQSRGRKVSIQSFPDMARQSGWITRRPTLHKEHQYQTCRLGKTLPSTLPSFYYPATGTWWGEIMPEEGQSPEALAKGLQSLSRWEKSLRVSVGVFHSQGHSIVFPNTAFSPTWGYQSDILLERTEILFSICQSPSRILAQVPTAD